jgi:hypothetical protein
VPLIPLHGAHLRDQRFHAAHFHAVYDVRNLHDGCLTAQYAA